MKIGIDFGTSFSMPAGLIDGRPSVLLPSGEYGIPSVFYYDSEIGVQVGVAAEENADYQPDNVKRNIKMEISSGAGPFMADGKFFTTTQICGYIFREVARVAEEECKRRELIDQKIEGAVVSVPAAFNLRELNAIRSAAQLSKKDDGAGLRVLRFIREPVAAAISYFNAPNAEDEKTILVYDLGGGTCDVAIVRSDHQSDEWYHVLESEMARIGGRDWDKMLVDMVKRKYQAHAGSMAFDTEAEIKIYKQAIRAKHNLSSQASARVSVMINGRNYACVITREEFEYATEPILNRTMELVESLIQKCQTKVDYIVCVGGSSNMPQVRKAFERRYPNIAVKLYDPSNAIAFGAAIYAEHLDDEHYLRDICKFSYGGKYIENFEKYHDKNRLRIWNVIYKGSPLPASGTITSTKLEDGVTESYIALYESECTDDIYLPEKGVCIGSVSISGLTNSKKEDKIILTMTIDQSGLMQVEAIDMRTKKKAFAEIQLKDFKDG